MTSHRAVFDCMVFLQAAGRSASPARECLRCVSEGTLTLLLCDEILTEIRDVLSRPRILERFPSLPSGWLETFLPSIASQCLVVPNPSRHFALPRDPKDEPYVNLAIATKATFLVSHDKDLLDLMNDAEFRALAPYLRIVTPSELLRVLRQPSVPTRGTLLGLDYGTKRIGVAVSTPDQTIASPLENYTRRNPKDEAAFIQKIAKEYQAVGLVVGLPVHMSGDEGTKAREARAFGEWAGNACGLPVVFWDERYSSAMAGLYLQQAEVNRKKQKSKLDKVAAQLVLQAFLDSDNRTAAPGRWDS